MWWRGGRILFGDEAEAHLEEGGDHGGPDESAIPLLPAVLASGVKNATVLGESLTNSEDCRSESVT
jgi:hypothetical protein